MSDDLAASNFNRCYSLAASSFAIFTITLFFLYPKFTSGKMDPWLFQATVVVLGVAPFSFVFASLFYYCASLSGRFGDTERSKYTRRGARIWLLGYTLLFFAPGVILFSIGLLAVGSVWLALWAVYALFVIRCFPKIQTDAHVARV